MDFTQLLDPVLTEGIKSTHFFNGRVLTAQDLRTEQEATRAQERRLARGIGEGIVHGLRVTAQKPSNGVPVVRIEAGLGFNRDGEPLALAGPVKLRLLTEEQDVGEEAGLFAVCHPAARPLDLTNIGLYVLTIRPASGYSRERAPMTELNGDGVARGCGSRWAVEGVRFSVVPLPLAPAGEDPSPLASSLASLAADVDADVDIVRRTGNAAPADVRTRLRERLSRLRNGAAHLCFGTDTLVPKREASAAQQPFPPPTGSALERLRERGELASCELPLALFHLTRRGVEWLDLWSVRRPPSPGWESDTARLSANRRAIERTCMYRQFQEQLEEIVAGESAALGTVRAKARFRYLPPMGVLPLGGIRGSKGFDHIRLFQGLTSPTPTFIEGAKLEALLLGSLRYPPIDLESGEMIRRYFVHERATDGAAHALQTYLVFTNGHMPFAGAAQYDLAYWSYANFA